MDINIKQISALEKIRTRNDIKNEVNKVTMFLGEHYSYQIVLEAEGCVVTDIEVQSEISQYVNVYSVENCIMDFPVSSDASDEDYITKEPGLMPDMLVRVDKQQNKQMFIGGIKAFWVEIGVPREFAAGNYDVNVIFRSIECLLPSLILMLVGIILIKKKNKS